jgi:hypothetical protein
MDGYWKRLGHFCGVMSVLVGCRGDALREARGMKQEFVATDLDGQCRFIRARGSGRFLDADTVLVTNVRTNPYVGDSTQTWCFTLQGTQNGTRYFTVQHQTFGGRFLDSSVSNDVILRGEEHHSSQEWLLGAAGAPDSGEGEAGAGPQLPEATTNTRLRQRSTNRYLHEHMHPLFGQTDVYTQTSRPGAVQKWDLVD